MKPDLLPPLEGVRVLHDQIGPRLAGEAHVGQPGRFDRIRQLLVRFPLQERDVVREEDIPLAEAPDVLEVLNDALGRKASGASLIEDPDAAEVAVERAAARCLDAGRGGAKAVVVQVSVAFRQLPVGKR